MADLAQDMEASIVVINPLSDRLRLWYMSLPPSAGLDTAEDGFLNPNGIRLNDRVDARMPPFSLLHDQDFSTSCDNEIGATRCGRG